MDKIDIEDLKKGGLRQQLKVGKFYKFTLGPLVKANKTAVGDMFEFNSKTFKMTPLLKKRITLAINLMRLPKK